MPTIRFTPSQTPESLDDIARREYNPENWELIYDKDMVDEVIAISPQQVWIALDRGGIALFNGDAWIEQDFGFSDMINDMAVSSNGIIWVSGQQDISRYQDGNWEVFPIPNVNETARIRLAVDSSRAVWIATPLCNCKEGLKRFDGNNWSEMSITNEHLIPTHLVFTDYDDNLWASFGWPQGIGKYDGNTWKIFRGEDLWPGWLPTGIRLASDNHGNILGMSEDQDWIVQINSNDEIQKIPFDTRFSLNPIRLRLFVDNQDSIWVNACLEKNACLAYYKDDQWVFWRNLPFSTAADMDQLPDGTMLIATEKGLYRFDAVE